MTSQVAALGVFEQLDQVPTKNWHEILADPTIADAICDRLVQNAHVIGLKGSSDREKKGLEIESSQPTA